jgi:aminoglycoside phosphotransferase (APT) family kinase protein
MQLSDADSALACLPQKAEQWLTRHVSGYPGPGELKKFGFGQSNPTYRLETSSNNDVLHAWRDSVRFKAPVR